MMVSLITTNLWGVLMIIAYVKYSHLYRDISRLFLLSLSLDIKYIFHESQVRVI